MSVDIEKAVQLHANGDKDEALKLYIQNLKTSNPDLRAFMNAPVLLRANGKQKEAINILKSGIKGTRKTQAYTIILAMHNRIYTNTMKLFLAIESV